MSPLVFCEQTLFIALLCDQNSRQINIYYFFKNYAPQVACAGSNTSRDVGINVSSVAEVLSASFGRTFKT
jgi:hypothetical protein